MIVFDDDEIDELFRPEEDGGASLQRRVSVQTEAEPEGEISVPGASVLDEERAELEEREVDDMARSVEDNERRDGVDRRYEAIRGQVRQPGGEGGWKHPTLWRWSSSWWGQQRRRRRSTRRGRTQIEITGCSIHVETCCRGITWCGGRICFNPAQAEESPVPLRSLKSERLTRRLEKDGEERVVSDEWSLFSRLEEKFNWWKGITEFKVDPHFLHVATEAAGPNMKKKRGEGEVFSS